MYDSDDNLAVKYWKFVYQSCWIVVKWCFYGLLLVGLVVCLGIKGSSVFFGVTILLFCVYYWWTLPLIN